MFIQNQIMQKLKTHSNKLMHNNSLWNCKGKLLYKYNYTTYMKENCVKKLADTIIA